MKSQQRGDILLHIHDLSDPNVELDLTSDPWRLKEGQCSNLIGLDVVDPGRFRPERGRLSADEVSPDTSEDLTDAWGSFDFAHITERKTYTLHPDVDVFLAGGDNVSDGISGDTITVTGHGINQNGPHTNDSVAICKPAAAKGQYAVSSITANTIVLSTTPGGAPSTLTSWYYFSHRSTMFVWTIDGDDYLVKSPNLYATDGAFTSNDVGQTVFFDDDERATDEQRRETTALATCFLSNDSVKLSGKAVQDSGFTYSKVTMFTAYDSDQRGMWVTNGRIFWLLQNGTWNKKLQLDSSVPYGTRWSMAKITQNITMFASPDFPARIVRMSDPNVTTDADSSSLAGCPAPKKPTSYEDADLGWGNEPSFTAASYIQANTGALDSSGEYKVQIRAVNLDENLESEFVQVYEDHEPSSTTSLAHPKQTIISTDATHNALRVGIPMRDRYFGPPVSQRWTHLEVWRTTNAGTTYFLESRVALVGSELADTAPAGWAANENLHNNRPSIMEPDEQGQSAVVEIDDDLIIAFPPKVANDLIYGKLPPICQDVVSLAGTTYCFGKANAGAVRTSSLYAYNYSGKNGSSDVYTDDYEDDTASFLQYRHQLGDELVIYDGGMDAGGAEGVAAVYTIDGDRGNPFNNVDNIVALTSLSTNEANDNTGTETNVTDGRLTDGRLDDGYSSLQYNNTCLRLNFETFPEDELGIDSVLYVAGRCTVYTSGDVTIRAYPYGNYSSGIVDSAQAVFSGGSPITATHPFTEDAVIFRIPFSAQTFIDNLDNTGGDWAVRLFLKASDNSNCTMEINQVWWSNGRRVEMESGTFQSAFGNIADDDRKPRAVIRRAYDVKYPILESDEEFTHSRLDKNAPESFSDLRTVLSRNGDTYRKAVPVGNYIAAVMDQGVHLVWNASGTASVDTVATYGEGTPWRDSVVVAGRVVVWATPQGAKVLKVSNDPNIEGERGVIAPLGGDKFRSWFSEAYDLGESIDAGADLHNGCLRFRRARTVSGAGTNYQVLQYSFRTDRWTLLDDDYGFKYVPGLNAVSSYPPGQRLYSLGTLGSLFEVNRGSVYNHPTEDVTPTFGASCSAGSTTTTSSGNFNSSMLGEVIRFTSAGVNDGLIRVITAASSTSITWAPALTTATVSGDSAHIGAVRFQCKFAPFRGAAPAAHKTLRDVKVIATEGLKGSTSNSITVKVYRDYESASLDSDTVTIFEHDAASKTSHDRHSGVECSGTSMELELKVDDAHTDFAIEHLEATVEEEMDDISDGVS